MTTLALLLIAFPRAAAQDAVPPGVPTNVQSRPVAETRCEVTWIVPGDDGFNAASGPPTTYEARHSGVPITAATYDAAAPWTLALPDPRQRDPGDVEVLEVNDLASEGSFYLAIRAVDENGNRSVVSESVLVSTAGFDDEGDSRQELPCAGSAGAVRPGFAGSGVLAASLVLLLRRSGAARRV